MAIKSFADTSAVSLAYAFSDAATGTELPSGIPMNLIPFRDEGFTMAKESQSSTAISDSRRVKGSKNTKGTASGSVTLEFGAIKFSLDMLQATLMNTWKSKGAGEMHIWDSNEKQYMVFEKTMRPDAGPTKQQYHEHFYGTLVNSLTMELGDGELITLAIDTMSAFADYKDGVQGADGLGGSLATVKAIPADYEIADSSNNLENFILRDAEGNPLELTFASASLAIENNVREQPGLGHVFSAGMGMGKVGVSTSAEVYYFDQTILDVHMNNKRMTGEYIIQTREGKFEFFFPNMVAQSPESSASGENQDYTTSLTLTAEEGVYEGERCCIYVKYTPAAGTPVPAPTPTPGSFAADDTNPTFSDWESAVTGNTIDFSAITALQAIDGDSVALTLSAGGSPVSLSTATSVTRVNPDSTSDTLSVPVGDVLLVSTEWGQGTFTVYVTLADTSVVTADLTITSVTLAAGAPPAPTPTPGSFVADDTNPTFSDWEAAVSGSTIDFSAITALQAIDGDSVAMTLNAEGSPVELSTAISIERVNPDSTSDSISVPVDDVLLVSTDWGQVGAYSVSVTLADTSVVMADLTITSVTLQ